LRHSYRALTREQPLPAALGRVTDHLVSVRNTSRRLAGPVRELCAVPGGWRLEAGACLYRLGGGVPLALLLLLWQASGSMGFAASAVALYACARAAASPLRGRLLDRRAPRAALRPLAAVHLTVLAGAAVAAPVPGAQAVVLAAAGVAGAVQPPVGTAMRTAWHAVLAGREAQIATAYSLETVLNQLGAVLAPMVAGVLAAVAGPPVALMTTSALVASGALLFATAPAAAHARPRTGRATGTVHSTALWVLVLLWAPVGAAIAGLEVLAPLVAAQRGSTSAAGALVATLAAGTFVGGVIAGALPRPQHPSRALALQLLGLVGCLLLARAVATTPGPWLGLALAACGGCYGQAITSAGLVLDAVTPRGVESEAFGWLLAAHLLGGALAAFAVGAIAEQHEPAVAFALPVLAGAAAAIITLATMPTRLLTTRREEPR
jgi:MFS family permease